MSGMKKAKLVYLDYAATAPLDPIVKKTMEPFLSEFFGNPSSLHEKGLEAKRGLDSSREIVSKILGARAEEIIFTSGGTESCNLAIFGSLKNLKPGHIITSQIEHHAVLEPMQELERLGWKVTYLKVDAVGSVDINDIKKSIRYNTALVSIMYANNEIGTIEPIAEIGKLLLTLNLKRKQKILFHTDACQAPGYLNLNVNKLLVDLMSLSGSKFYGPKGVGALYVRKGTEIKPIVYGGGQEFGFRSGTENVAGIVGMAKALELITETNNSKILDLRNYFITKALKQITSIKLNGPEPRRNTGDDVRLPNNINFSIKGLEGEALMLYLDAHGICASTASACSTSSTERSHVIKSIGVKNKWARGTIRFTLGKHTTKKEIDYVIFKLKVLVELLRRSKGTIK